MWFLHTNLIHPYDVPEVEVDPDLESLDDNDPDRFIPAGSVA